LKEGGGREFASTGGRIHPGPAGGPNNKRATAFQIIPGVLQATIGRLHGTQQAMLTGMLAAGHTCDSISGRVALESCFSSGVRAMAA